MAEQFAFQQRLTHRPAIHGYEALVLPLAVVVNGSSDKFLAGSGFAVDDDGCVRLSEGLD